MDDNRGKITYRERAKKIRDFSGLIYANKITPTDIDLYIDFGNKAFVYGELKVEGTDLPFGQQLALEREHNNALLAGKRAIIIIGSHNTPCHIDIDVATCKVEKYRTGKEWKTINCNIKQLIDKFLFKINLSEYIMKNETDGIVDWALKNIN